MDCLQEDCMAWSNSDCRMFAGPALFTGLTGVRAPESQPAITTETQNETAAENNNGEKQDKSNPVAIVTITEFKVTQNGNTRAVCRAENGKDDQVIIAKNGVGKAIQEGLNKKFEIEYNVMKDGTAWFAIKAKQI